VRNAAGMLPNEQLRLERQRRGWSREYVAEQIGLADSKTIGRWERGVAFPSSYFLQKLCALFGMLAQDLGLYQEEGSNFLASGQLLISSPPIHRGENNDFSLSTPGLEPSGEQVGMQHTSLTTGVVQDMILTYQQDGVDLTAEVGSAAWFGWLEQATAFTFRDAAGQFTAVLATSDIRSKISQSLLTSD
jgi:transcriptional regulator with XRE-family HTH domain